ncbi:MAG: hypothetical protein K2K92_01850 [Duncaniella sp.]|nr:hypothetical protein [Duncaniella sp.]
MNSIFCYSRFRRLLRKYIADSWPHLRLMALILLAVCVLTAVACGFNRPYYGLGGISFMGLIAVITGLKVMSGSFSRLSDRVGCVMELTTPGTPLEKLAARWLVSFPLWIVWTLICLIFAGLAYAIVSYALTGELHFINLPWLLTNPGTYEWLLVYMALHSFYMLGSLVWRKVHFQKTTLSLMLLGFIYAVALVLLMKGTRHLPSGYELMESIAPVCIAATVVNYIISWFRLRETQVINHW